MEPSANFALSTALAIDVTLVALIVVGFLLRIQAALRIPLFVDEVFSLLAIDAVGTRGAPVLPSGVLYLHGATMSYVLAPWLRLGLVQAEDITPFRFLSAIAGAAAIYLTYRLARRVGGRDWTAVLAAGLVAFDPTSVEWSGYVRMYALAETLTIAVVLVFMNLLHEDSDRGRATANLRLDVALMLLFWLAVYTHLATALLWPPMALLALVFFGRELLRSRKDLLFTLAACLAAPLSLVALTGAVGAGAGTKIVARAEGIPGVSFLGDDKISFRQMLEPNPSVWASLFGPGPLEHLLPLLMTVASTILLVRCVRDTPRTSRLTGSNRVIAALLTMYWGPVFLMAFLAGDASTRYGLFLVPLGCVILALATETVVTLLWDRFGSGRRLLNLGSLFASAVVTLMLVHDAVGVSEMLRIAASGKRDLTPSLRYAAEHRQADDWVISVVPPPMAAYVLGSDNSLAFLPGGESSNRTLRYSRINPDGEVTDYWMGVPSLATFDRLCGFLAANPDAWVVVDKGFWRTWGYSGGSKDRIERLSGAMRAIVTGTGTQAFVDRAGMVTRVNTTSQWSAEATTYCNQARDRAALMGAGESASNPEAAIAEPVADWDRKTKREVVPTYAIPTSVPSFAATPTPTS